MKKTSGSIDIRPPLLRMRGISKRFPGVQALDCVDFSVVGGEVHALVGENGAGKSTLMHILSGVCKPDGGSIDFGGQSDINIADEQTAQRLGIAIVFQERSLFAPLSVAENLFAGRQPCHRFGWIDRRGMMQAARSLLTQVGLKVDPSSAVATLSPHEQQLVEVAKALSLEVRLIIFDEPTAALSKTETVALFQVIERLKRQGTAVIYISHRLEEIFQIADRVTVLKDGRLQATMPIAESSPQALIRHMVGRDISEMLPRRRGVVGPKVPVLEVRDLSDHGVGPADRVQLDGINFSVNRGEILVFSGLAGAGKTESALATFGARPSAQGHFAVDGQTVRIRDVADAIGAGIGYLPEDRKEAGLFLQMHIADNMAAASLTQFGRTWMSDRQRDLVAVDYCRRLRIGSGRIHQPVGNLSGGNQQKVLLARWLLANPKVLIVDEPTRGMDVGAKADVHQLLHELADRGTAVMLISSDLPEVLTVADRILVMAAGRIAGELSRQEASEEAVMRLASLS